MIITEIFANFSGLPPLYRTRLKRSRMRFRRVRIQYHCIYVAAITLIRKKALATILDNRGHKSLYYYIFTDDVAFARENFDFLENYTIVSEHNFPAYIDMYLMSLCRDNIIANSTFSWWAAYLNVNMNKNIIAPENWLTPEAMQKHNIKLGDIIPETWITL